MLYRGIALIVLAHTHLAVARGNDNQPISMETVAAAWKDREARVRSFDFSWAGNKLGMDDIDYMPGEEPLGSKKPPEHVTFPIQVRLVMDPTGRALSVYTGKTWSFELGELISKTNIDVSDGHVCTTFFPSGTGSIRFPNAHIKDGDTRSAVFNMDTVPILLFYRPFGLRLLEPTKLALTKHQGIVDGRSCPILSWSRGHREEGTIWVDPSKDFAPVRYYEFERGAPTHSLEIAYSPDDQAGWIPTSWKDAWSNPKGETVRSSTIKVTDHKVNVPIADSTFEIDYPAGTWVHNYITKEEYILRGEGDKRPILPGEYNGENYEQLLHSDPPGTSLKRWLRWLIPANVVLLVTIIALSIYRRLKLAKSRKPLGSAP